MSNSLKCLQGSVVANRATTQFKLGGNDLLTHAGKISAQQAQEKAHLEYDKFRKVIDINVSQVDKDLEAVLKKLPKPPSKGGQS